MDRHSESETGKLHGTGNLGLALAAIAILYVVFLGPLARFYDSFPHPIQMGIEGIYYPLERLDRMLPERPFTKYIEFWRR